MSDKGPGITTTLIVLACVAALTLLVYTSKVNGDAAIAVISSIIGGVIHAAGTRGGSKAAVDPPSDA